MKKSTHDKQKQFAYTRKCLLHEIKKCNKIIHTNRINQKFCCDSHRYQWHNSMKALFRRVTKLEITVDGLERTSKAFGENMDSLINSMKVLSGILKTIAPDYEDLK